MIIQQKHTTSGTWGYKLGGKKRGFVVEVSSLLLKISLSFNQSNKPTEIPLWNKYHKN